MGIICHDFIVTDLLSIEALKMEFAWIYDPVL